MLGFRDVKVWHPMLSHDGAKEQSIAIPNREERRRVAELDLEERREVRRLRNETISLSHQSGSPISKNKLTPKSSPMSTSIMTRSTSSLPLPAATLATNPAFPPSSTLGAHQGLLPLSSIHTFPTSTSGCKNASTASGERGALSGCASRRSGEER